jgi:predicted metal-dependent hydrolase
MGRHFEIGNPPIAVDLRRSARAKRLSLRISRLDGRVTLTMPLRAPEREALAFAQAREDWMRGHIAQVIVGQSAVIGGTVPLRGIEVPLVAATGRRVLLKDGVLHVPGAQDQVGTRVQAFLKVEARNALAQAADRYAQTLGKPYSRLSLRDTRSRWGSCSSKGVLMFSWRLIMAPPVVLDYVAAHEVAHLQVMNHSAAFWDVVAQLMPDYAAHRAWLRQHGESLHRMRFSD